jgi:hypothetical protein
MRTITISSKNKKLINEIFGNDESGFIKIAISRNSHADKGEVRMWVNVIKSGFLELDYEFILSGGCKSICDSLLLRYDWVIAAFLRVEEAIFEEFKNG